jgi:hypothetical protein
MRPRVQVHIHESIRPNVDGVVDYLAVHLGAVLVPQVCDLYQVGDAGGDSLSPVSGQTTAAPGSALQSQRHRSGEPSSRHGALLASAALTPLLPALRAMQVDPIIALPEE